MADYYIETTTGEELPAHSSPLSVEAIDEALVAAQNSVRFDKEQFLSEARKAKARANIGVSKGGEFKPVGFFETYELMEAALPNPEPGVFAGVGTAPPYDFYCWDGYHQKWEPQGQLTSGQGSGLPPGGTEGQVLSKASDEDGDAEWKDVVARAKVDAEAPAEPDKGDFWFDEDENNEFTVDNAPTSGSSNLVTSGGVYSALQTATNNLGAEIDTKISIVKLWENTSLSSGFAAQTVALDLSEYDGIIVVFVADSNKGRAGSYVSAVKTLLHEASLQADTYKRNFRMTNSGVYFSNGSYTGSENNAAMLPYIIFGIRGVQT